MILEFYMQHDEASGLQNNEIQPGRESKMAALAKKSLTIKISFFSRITCFYFSETLYRALEGPWFSELSKWKTCGRIRSQWHTSGLQVLFFQVLMKHWTFSQNDLQLSFKFMLLENPRWWSPADKQNSKNMKWQFSRTSERNQTNIVSQKSWHKTIKSFYKSTI